MPANKTLTDAQIKAAALKSGIEYAALRAVTQVECRGKGFDAYGAPVILFERHKFYQRLPLKLRIQAYKERPDLCNPAPGGYGLYTAQQSRLQSACKYNRPAALESASWGIGQVMGYQWQSLGYPSLQDFINAMYRDEASQLDAMIRYIKVNKLSDELARHDWAGFARGYNGPSYAKNQYDEKLAEAYKLYAGQAK